MRLFLRSFVFILLAFPMLASSSGYILGVGDEISIQVFQEEELSFGSVVIPENGTISYPFLGDLSVTGRTVDSLQKEITESLRGDYLVSPKVSVYIKQYRGFFVDGQVNNPGQYPYEPGLTVRKAISIGGGVNERAASDSVYIIKDGDKDKKSVKVSLDTFMNPGDIIFVEESFF